jgi:phosphohistidine phosphatase
MRSILLVRHAKSSWGNPAMADFDRPLNDRGNRDAPIMAKRLLEKDITIDLFVSSPALRALTTAKYFHEAYKAKKENLIQIPGLYHASVNEFNRVIDQMDDQFHCIAIFSHNPGITEMVNSLNVAKVDNMPTCAVFGVRADIKSWTDFQDAAKQFWFFDYPKLEV